MCRMNPKGSTRGSEHQLTFLTRWRVESAAICFIQYVISRPGYRRARGRAQAVVWFPCESHAAHGEHDILAGRVSDRSTLDCFAARKEFK